MFKSRINEEEQFLTEDSYAVHLWARRLKPRLHATEHNRPRRKSFLYKAIKKHGIVPADAPIQFHKRPEPTAQT